MQFIPELNLNKHPKNCKNYSLIDAMDVKLSNDFSCLQNENKLDTSNIINGKIKGVIECNKELIIFVLEKVSTENVIAIYRYTETNRITRKVGYLATQYPNLSYVLKEYTDDIEIKGTFTYNINNELITSFTIIGANEPLYTVNFGKINEDGTTDYTNSDIKSFSTIEGNNYTGILLNKASLVPEVNIPRIDNITYIKANNYKGWYHFFIRYKINNTDYTQWYHIGSPILINNIERQDIIKYYEQGYPGIGQTAEFDGIRMGCADFFGNQLDTTDEGVEFKIKDIDRRYEYLQVGCICVTNTLQKAFCGYDIKIPDGPTYYINFIVDHKWFKEYNVNDLITSYNNYYNVNNLTNYKNRLYIGDYKENNNTNLQSFTDECIYFKPIKELVNDISSVGRKGSVKKADNDYDSESYETAMNKDGGIYYIDTKETFNDRKINRTLLPNEYYRFYIHYVDKYGIATEGYFINNQEFGDYNFKFEEYTNYNNDKVYKIFDTNSDANHFDYTETSNYGYYKYLRFKIAVKADFLPDEYVGYFISYEKFNRNSITGVFCVKDCIDVTLKRFTTPTSHKDIYFPEQKVNNNDKIYQFFSEHLYEDNIKTNYNVDKILHFNFTKKEFNKRITDSSGKPTLSIYSKLKNYLNLNAPMLKDDGHILFNEDNIKRIDYKLANHNDRLDKGTCFEITQDSYTELDVYANKVAILCNSNEKEQYLNKNKDLIKLSDVIYGYSSARYNIIEYGYNGCITFNCPIIYCDDGVKLTPKDRTYRNLLKLYADLGDDKDAAVNYIYRTNVDMIVDVSKFLAYVQIPVYNDYFFETKEFKNKPDLKLFLKSNIGEDDNKVSIYENGYFVIPANVNDLFVNRIKSQDEYNPVIYSNNTDNIKINKFDKTVRRSSVISDESFENTWRKFPTEDYKQIFENKGKITNLVGLGNYLLVHTQHSLFAFNASNKLKTAEGGDIQISNPDIWDVQYEEIVSSELGMCGLQDKNAYIYDDFGYIFYDNDAHRIYKFGSGKIDTIDSNIEIFLDKYKPSKIRFGVDKESSRLLLNITFNSTETQEECLSYNYKTGTFVSRHSYRFKNAYKTKNIGYFIVTNNTTDLDDIKLFNYNNKSNINYAINSYIDIICNTDYELIKALEYIIYKLYKIEELSEAYSPSAVDASNGRRRTPYSGIELKVKSDLNETTLLDITTDIQIDRPASDNINNYKKPYFYLGNWNYNYLRDTRDENMRINGNYFVVHIKLNDATNTNRIEFEGIDCITNKYK